MEAVVTAIITGGLSLLGVIISNIVSNRRVASDVENQLKIAQAVTNTQLENLTEEVKKHNNFASRVPVLEEQVKVANHRIEDLERRVGA